MVDASVLSHPTFQCLYFRIRGSAQMCIYMRVNMCVSVFISVGLCVRLIWLSTCKLRALISSFCVLVYGCVRPVSSAELTQTRTRVLCSMHVLHTGIICLYLLQPFLAKRYRTFCFWLVWWKIVADWPHWLVLQLWQRSVPRFADLCWRPTIVPPFGP